MQEMNGDWTKVKIILHTRRILDVLLRHALTCTHISMDVLVFPSSTFSKIFHYGVDV